MPRELFIVARDRMDLFEYLSQTFLEADAIRVVLDRRQGERRQQDAACPGDRRRADRRARPRIDAEIRSRGYAYLALA
ncbi:MAG: hypothetical protein HY727_10620 [Candidatus Rokubacteria bacterium]|nr:hypothetical protein [Candidatus Rokubacteria bacterium]